MTSDTHEAGGQIDGEVRLVGVDLASINIPRAQHRLVSAPVLVIQPTITDSREVEATTAKIIRNRRLLLGPCTSHVPTHKMGLEATSLTKTDTSSVT